MIRILNNKLLLVLLAIPILCWGPGLYLPGEWISLFASTIILMGGSFSLWQRRFIIFDVVFLGRRDEMEPRSHYGVVGDFLIAIGLIYSAAFAYWWVWAGQPPGWQGTMYSNYGRILIGAGLISNIYMAHPLPIEGQIQPSRLWTIIALILAFLAGMLFYSVLPAADRETAFVQMMFPHLANRPTCPADRPVWGSSNKIYHTDGSPYRSMVIPDHCFASAQEAESKGFRPPKGLAAN